MRFSNASTDSSRTRSSSMTPNTASSSAVSSRPRGTIWQRAKRQEKQSHGRPTTCSATQGNSTSRNGSGRPARSSWTSSTSSTKPVPPTRRSMSGSWVALTDPEWDGSGAAGRLRVLADQVLGVAQSPSRTLPAPARRHWPTNRRSRNALKSSAGSRRSTCPPAMPAFGALRVGTRRLHAHAHWS